MFFRWIKEICEIHTQYNCIIDFNDLISFFKQHLSGNTNSLRHLSTEGFNCIQSFFLLINENAGKIRRLSSTTSSSSGGNKMTSYSNTG